MDYYFDPAVVSGGSGTQVSPWPMSRVSTVGAAGDRLLFKKGSTYTGTINYSASGAVGNPITFDLYGTGNNAVLNGGGANAPVLQISGSYITINNLVLQNNTSPNGIIYLGSGIHDITINNCYINTGIRGVNVWHCGSGGVANIKILHNYFANIHDNDSHSNGGGSPIQFNNSVGSGQEVAYNNIYTDMSQNTLGVGDLISLYQSFGTASSYMLVHDNNLLGGSLNTRGYCGITLGDVGGGYQRVYNNKIVNAGNAGIQLVGGSNIIADNNQIFGSYSVIAAQGITVGYFGGGTTPANWTCTNNKVNFTNHNNNKYSWFVSPIAGTPPVSMSTNTPQFGYDTTITSALLPNPLWTGSPWNTTGLTFGSLAPRTYGAADFDPGATGPNPITYSSSDISIATIVSGKVHIVKSGTCTITATDGTTTISQSLTINKAVLNVIADPQSKPYGRANPSLTASFSSFVLGESSSVLTSQPSLATTANTSSVVGTYPITPSGATAINYSFNYINGTLTVTKALLIVTADNKTKVYGAALPTLTITYSGLTNGDTPASLTTQPVPATTATNSSAAGSYPITVSGGVASNYSFSYTAGSLTVSQAPLTITADNKTKAQNTANPALTASYTGLVNGDTSSTFGTAPTLATTAVTGSLPGNYPITITGASSANYTITQVPGILTISSNAIVFPSILPKTYGSADFDPGATSAGNTITYSSDNPAVATIVSNLVHIVGAGSCNITANNGSITSSQPLTVAKANLSVTPDNHVIILGADIPALTISYSGFIGTESISNLTTQPTATTTATSSSPVGSYPVTASGGVAANYNFVYTDGSINIITNNTIIFHIPIVVKVSL